MPVPSRLTLSLIVASLAALSITARAETEWQKAHPRRAEVNGRLANQDRRIHKEVKDGDMTHAEARNLHTQDRAIRREERTMAGQNGGHITKAEQKALNQQETTVSKEIGK